MKKIIIIGNSSYADTIRYYIENDGQREVVAYAVEKEYLDAQTRNGLPLVDIDNIQDIYDATEYSIIIGIGYKNMNKIRERLFYICIEKGYEIENFIHSTAIIDKNACIGKGNIILERVVVGPNCNIGDGNLIFIGSVLAHDDQVGNFNMFSVNVSIAGFVKIENNCFMGINSTIKNGINVPSSVLVGASAYMSSEVMSGQVLVPERSIVLKDKLSTDFI